MIINSIIGGGGGTTVNMRTYNITTQLTWSAFFTDCAFQLKYKNSTIAFHVTGSTAPTAGATTTILIFTQLNNGSVRSQLYRNTLGSSSDLKTPDYVNSTTTNFSSQGSTATLVSGYYGISSAGVITAGGSTIGSVIPADATVTISEAPLSSDLWGS